MKKLQYLLLCTLLLLMTACEKDTEPSNFAPGLISVLGLQAQVTECMRIYTDKDNYLAGEDLWIKVCVTDSAEAPFSKVAYVEISDMRQVYAQGKIALKNGTGWGRIKFPQTMHSGA